MVANLDALPVPACVLDLDGVVVGCNAAAAEQFGIADVDALDRPIRALPRGRTPSGVAVRRR